VIPTLGGDERKLADHGKNPRFSPDGKWIAYAVGEGSGLRVFVVPATGGESRRMASGFGPSASPHSGRRMASTC
jgi:Tol biopolymer transport system component